MNIISTFTFETSQMKNGLLLAREKLTSINKSCAKFFKLSGMQCFIRNCIGHFLPVNTNCTNIRRISQKQSKMQGQQKTDHCKWRIQLRREISEDRKRKNCREF